MTTSRVVLGTAVWLAAALVLGASGIPTSWRPPLPQLVILGLALTSVALALGVAALRRWVMGVDVRAFVLIHLTRIVAGAYFLVLYRRGELPYLFAVPGGIGDIIAGTLAIVVLVAPRRSWLFGWNVLALIDILMVIVAATRSVLAAPESMNAILRLPLSCCRCGSCR